MGVRLGLGFEEALWRNGEVSVFDGGAVASHVDGVHDGEGAAYAEGEAEEEADQAGIEAHTIDDGTLCGAWLPVVVGMTYVMQCWFNSEMGCARGDGSRD